MINTAIGTQQLKQHLKNVGNISATPRVKAIVYQGRALTR